MKHTLYWLKQSRASHIQKNLQVKYNSEFLCFQSKCSDLIYIDKIGDRQISPSWTSLMQCMRLNSLGDVYCHIPCHAPCALMLSRPVTPHHLPLPCALPPSAITLRTDEPSGYLAVYFSNLTSFEQSRVDVIRL